MHLHIALLISVLAVAEGCDSAKRRDPGDFANQDIQKRPAIDPSKPLNGTDALQWLSSQSTAVTFVSRGGRMYGMDSDAAITLKSNRQVEVTEYGYTVQTYNGTYSVDATGAIHVELQDYRAKWPAMYLYNSPTGTFLFPTNKDPAFRLGARAGAVETGEMAPYWPFRKTK